MAGHPDDNAAEQLAQLDLELSEERAQTFTVLHQVDDVQRTENGDFDSALRAIGETTVESVPGAQYAGLTVIEGIEHITTKGATHRYPPPCSTRCNAKTARALAFRGVDSSDHPHRRSCY